MAKGSATIDVTALKVAGAANKYVTYIDATNGIRVHKAGEENSNFAQINSNGLQVYKGGQTNDYKIAEFGTITYIGKHNNTQSYIQLDYHSLQMIDKEGNTYFYISDLRNEEGITSITETFRGDGSTTRFNLSLTASSTSYTVTVSDDSGGTVSKYTSYFKFASAPTNNATITVSYDTTSSDAKAYTFGWRRSGETLGPYSTAIGSQVTASGYSSLAEGINSFATGSASHAEGLALGSGNGPIASGEGAHAEGGSTVASGRAAHSEGFGTQASGQYSHAEGCGTEASGIYSHAEGYNTHAFGISHAEGASTIAGSNTAGKAHAEGEGSEATGAWSHAQNYYTIAASQYQTAIGRHNISDSLNTYAFIIGNGSSSTRSNALTVDWSGNVNIASGAKYKINGTALSASDVGAVPTSRTVNSKALSSDITLSAADVSAIALSDKYTRSSAGTIDWSNQTDGDTKVIMKSALAYWNGCYSGTSSNLSRCSQGQIIGRNQICYANSRVDTFSSGQITIANSSLGVTTGAKPVGIILTPEYGTAVIMKYNYDSSTATNSVIQCWNHDGTAYSGAMRYFAVVFQNTWTTT